MPPVPAGNKHAERFWEARLRWSRCSESRTLPGALPAAGGARGGAGPLGSISPPLLPPPRLRSRSPAAGAESAVRSGWAANPRTRLGRSRGRRHSGLPAGFRGLALAARPRSQRRAPAEPRRPGSGSARRRVAMAAGGSGRRGADGGCGGRGAVAAVGGLVAAGSSGSGRSARPPLRPPVPGPRPPRPQVRSLPVPRSVRSVLRHERRAGAGSGFPPQGATGDSAFLPSLGSEGRGAPRAAEAVAVLPKAAGLFLLLLLEFFVSDAPWSREGPCPR